MLRVAICDDSALERDILADFLSHYCDAIIKVDTER